MIKIKNIFKGDIGIWIIFFLWTVVSLASVYSSIGYTAVRLLKNTTPTEALFGHLVFILITYGIIILCSVANYKKLKNIFDSKLSYILYASIIILLFITFKYGDDGRWISFKLFKTFTIQTSEIAKLFIIVLMAHALVRNENKIKEPRIFFILIAMTLPICIPIAISNGSTGALILLTCFLMMLFGGVNRKYWLICAAIGLFAGSAFLYFCVNISEWFPELRFDTWGLRVRRWLEPDYSALNQENIARMAIWRGGISGSGIGSTIHARLITQAENDFIFSIIIEEYGSIIGVAIMILYHTFFFRCIKIARACKDQFGKYLVGGFATLIYVQALVNISVAVGLLPVTGQPLPFISKGGTAYILMGVGIGVIQSVAYNSQVDNKHTQQSQTNITQHESNN